MTSVKLLKLFSKSITKKFGSKVGLALGRVLHDVEQQEQDLKQLGDIIIAQRMMMREVPVGCLTLDELKRITKELKK